jgi:hypothetical protein
MTSCTNMLSKSSDMAVSSRLERIVQFLDEAAILADSFVAGDDQNYCNDHHDQPVFENVVTISNLPPLDQITICSESCSDNTSVCDVSSVTTDENDEMNQFFLARPTPKKGLSHPNHSLRTIFDRYWEKNRPVQVITAVSESNTEPVSPIRTEDETSSINTYERTLQESHGKTKEASTTTNPPSRRRIFQGLPPTPDLVDDLRVHRQPTKVQSDSCLLAKPPCLRRSRFSVSTTSSSSYSQPDCRRASSSSSSFTSVKFNPKVDVVIYRPPVEHFATKGWSDYFAS